MLRWLIILLVAVPVVEIWGLIAIGGRIGAWPTIALIVATGILGASLARREFRRVWAEAGRDLAAGRIPGRSVIDGLCVFAGGVLLLAPGFLTDILGILLLVPPTRTVFRNILIDLLRRRIDNGTFYFRRW
jgi:UPF0716 protein FxsA